MTYATPLKQTKINLTERGGGEEDECESDGSGKVTLWLCWQRRRSAEKGHIHLADSIFE